MTKLRVVVLLAVAALLLFPALTFAQGVDLPCRFYGTVLVNGAAVTEGTTITVAVGEDTYTTAVAASSYGASAFELKIEPGEGVHYAEGTPISFRIGDVAAPQTAAWEAGGNVRVNLAIGELPPTGGAIAAVNVEMISSSEAAYAEYDSTTGILTLYIPEGEAGPAGPKGDTGATGAVGPAGSGSIVIPIIAIIVAVIAAGMAAMSLRRRV
ncbi:MAG: hypothetical protein IBX68_09820 [Dehalococcoidia bacterium]|nr:hypothetical protein [Dehalococcoidia bacterium]